MPASRRSTRPSRRRATSRSSGSNRTWSTRSGSASTDHPDTWVDITDVLADKIDLICEHASQFPRESTEKAFTRMARETGALRGMGAAEAFRTLRLSASTVRALAEKDEA